MKKLRLWWAGVAKQIQAEYKRLSDAERQDLAFIGKHVTVQLKVAAEKHKTSAFGSRRRSQVANDMKAANHAAILRRLQHDSPEARLSALVSEASPDDAFDKFLNELLNSLMLYI